MTAGWREAVVECILAEALPVDKFGHMPRLYALTVRLGAGIEFDDDVVFAAAWMHDLGVFVRNTAERPGGVCEVGSCAVYRCAGSGTAGGMGVSGGETGRCGGSSQDAPAAWMSQFRWKRCY